MLFDLELAYEKALLDWSHNLVPFQGQQMSLDGLFGAPAEFHRWSLLGSNSLAEPGPQTRSLLPSLDVLESYHPSRASGNPHNPAQLLLLPIMQFILKNIGSLGDDGFGGSCWPSYESKRG